MLVDAWSATAIPVYVLTKALSLVQIEVVTAWPFKAGKHVLRGLTHVEWHAKGTATRVPREHLKLLTHTSS